MQILRSRHSAHTLRSPHGTTQRGPPIQSVGRFRISISYIALHHRDGGIRTRDPLNPIQVRYRAALRPVRRNYSTSRTV